MNAATLSKMCRCGHARRLHDTGTIFVGYQTKCHEFHRGWESTDCYYFEPGEGWQESFVAALRKEGYVVERVARDATGRFVRATP